MELTFERAAVVGATGPFGREIADWMHARGIRLRVVSRSLENLGRRFTDPAVEKRVADARAPGALLAAVDGCDLVINSVGLPPERMGEHPRIAASLSEVVARTGAYCVQISNWWSYMPIAAVPVSEQSAREDGPLWARYRRWAEDILVEAGAAVVQLPDFFGPGVQESILQRPLREAAAGRAMRWIGGGDVERDYLYLPDAVRLVGELAGCSEAYGERWLVPGSGPISGREVAEIASGVLGRRVRLRSAGPALLRAASLFDRDLGAFRPLVRDYVRPIRYDGSKLQGLLGARPRTPYELALERTLRAIQNDAR
jgi:nucleoside-diphosphate-sugar epimerase